MLFAASCDLFAFLEKMDVYQENRGFVCSLHSLYMHLLKTLLF